MKIIDEIFCVVSFSNYCINLMNAHELIHNWLRESCTIIFHYWTLSISITKETTLYTPSVWVWRTLETTISSCEASRVNYYLKWLTKL